MDCESICERMTRSLRNGIGGTRSAVVDHGNPSFMHGAKATTTIGCKSDQEVLEGVLQVVPAHDFTFARFIALSEAMGCE
jgi:RNA exonuclease 1